MMRVAVRTVVAAVLVGAAAIGPVGSGSVHAAPVDVEGCVIDGSPVTVTVDDETLAPYEGGWYALHTAMGTVVDHEADVGTLNEVTPVCVAPVTGGEIDSSGAMWAWCLEAFDHVCAEGPLEPQDEGPVLTDDEAQLVAWLIDQLAASGESSTEALHRTQFRIWCVTDEYEYAGTDWSPATDCPSFRAWLEAEVLPLVPTVSDTLAVTAPGPGTSAGTPQVITVTTSLAAVELTLTGADSIEVCDPATGTLTGTRLWPAVPGEPVDLCVNRATPGDVTVSAQSGARLISEWVMGHTDEDCQVFFTEVVETVRLDGAATATFAAVPTTTTTTTTTTIAPTTTAAPTTTVVDPATSTTSAPTTSVDPSGSTTTTTNAVVVPFPTTTAGATTTALATTTTVRRWGPLPATGNNSGSILVLAAVVLATGLAAAAVARRRSA